MSELIDVKVEMLNLNDYLRDIFKGKKWSISKLYIFNGCYQRGKYQYIDRIKTPEQDAIHFVKGRFVHTLFDRDIIRKVFPDQPLPKMYSLDKYPDIEAEDVLKWNKVFRTFTSTQFYIDLIKDLNLATYVHTEMEINLPLFTGFIDLFYIKDKILITKDWKTGKFKEEQNRVQVLIYTLYLLMVLSTKYEIIGVKNSYVFVESPETPEVGDKEPVMLKEFFEELKPHLDKIVGIQDKIQECMITGEWDRNFKKCEYCAFKIHCDTEHKSEIDDLISGLL